VGNYSPRDTLDFDVALDIKYNGSLIYSDTASVDFLFPDKERGVSFDEWIPDKAGEYTITAYTLLMGDVHPENDTQSIQLTAVGIREIKTSSFAFITPTLSNEEIKISYQLPYSTEVSINIYNISGKLIKNLVTCYSPQGYYTIIWDRRDTDGKKVPAGIYFVRLLTPRYKKTRKILLAR